MSIQQFLASFFLLVICCLPQSGCIGQDSCQRQSVSQRFIVLICDQKAGVERTNGEIIIPAEFDEIRYLEFPVYGKNLVFPIAHKVFVTFNSGSGKLQGKKTYEDGATDPVEMKNLFLVRQNNLWAVFDEKGNALTGFDYEQISHYDYSNYLIVTKNSLHGLVNLDGKEMIEPLYGSIDMVDQGFVRITRNKKAGIYNENLELIVQPKYDHLLSTWDAFHFEYHKFKFIRNNHWYDVGGTRYFKQNRELFSKYFWFVENGKYGLIDIKGKEITDGWDGIGYIIDGLVMVARKTDDRTIYGLIDLKGKIVTPVKYSAINPIKGEGYVAMTEELTIRLDKKGQVL